MSAPPSKQLPEHSQWFLEEVQPHSSLLKSWLRKRFPWLGDVDDIAQEAALRVWRQKMNAEALPPKSAKALLFAVARNAAIDVGRREALFERDCTGDSPHLAVLGEVDVVEDVSVRQELEFLADAIRDLPDRCRQVITLTKIFGYSERQVAIRLGISEHTVRTQVIRGMQRCADYLRHHGVKRGDQ